MTNIIEGKGTCGYLHHNIPTLTPELVTAKLEAEARRRNPGQGLQTMAEPIPPAPQAPQAFPSPQNTSG